MSAEIRSNDNTIDIDLPNGERLVVVLKGRLGDINSTFSSKVTELNQAQIEALEDNMGYLIGEIGLHHAAWCKISPDLDKYVPILGFVRGNKVQQVEGYLIAK